MSKRYVFLTNSVRNVGGSQLYVAGKMNWLRSEGWEVDVFYYNDGPIVIDGLKEFKNNRIPQLSMPFSILRNREKTKIVSKVCTGEYDKVIFESNEVHLCIWGEFFAQKTGGMNFCFPLSENMPKLTNEEKMFFNYKLNQNLLFGITKESIPLFLGKNKETENRDLVAVYSVQSNLSDDDYDLGNDFKEGKTIVSLGRLDKPYIEPMVNSIITFALRHKEDHFNLLLIGGAADLRVVDLLENKVKEANNISVVCTGYINPIPRSLIKKGNVAICSSGCVKLVAEQHVLTIVVDSNDHKAIGIYGITTTNTLYRKDEPQQEICDILDDVLYKKKYSGNVDVKIGLPDYSKHKQIIDTYVSGDTYDVNWPLTMKQRIKKILYLLVGLQMYKFLLG